MKTIETNIYDNIYFPSKFKNKLSNKNVAFFDIETTGFSRKNNNVILIGMLYQSKDCIVIKQFFAESLSDEKAILTSFKDVISNFDIYISYNGDTFDIPFLNAKYNMYNLDFSLDKDLSLDLLKIVKRNKDILQLENCKLKTIEKKLGLDRQDKISGKESVEMYKKFLKTQDENLKNTILKHNYDDIYYLPKLLNIYDFISQYNEVNFEIPYNDSNIKFTLNLERLLLKGDILSTSGIVENISIANQVYYDENYSFNLDTTKRDVNISIQLNQGYLSSHKECFYINTDNFNIPFDVEDQTSYNVPNNIIIVKEEGKFIYPNIKNIFSNLIFNIFQNII